MTMIMLRVRLRLGLLSDGCSCSTTLVVAIVFWAASDIVNVDILGILHCWTRTTKSERGARSPLDSGSRGGSNGGRCGSATCRLHSSSSPSHDDTRAESASETLPGEDLNTE